jgi:hypothetical protein
VRFSKPFYVPKLFIDNSPLRIYWSLKALKNKKSDFDVYTFWGLKIFFLVKAAYEKMV